MISPPAVVVEHPLEVRSGRVQLEAGGLQAVARRDVLGIDAGLEQLDPTSPGSSNSAPIIARPSPRPRTAGSITNAIDPVDTSIVSVMSGPSGPSPSNPVQRSNVPQSI